MSITDELREYVGNFYLFRYADAREKLYAIADRIDVAHKHAIGYVDDRDPETMAENGWVKLPVDADGVPIHVGDYVETLIDAFKGERGRVECLTLTEDGWCVDGDAPSTVRHYHAPTVEDVLREFAEKITDSQIPNVHPTYEEAIAEYAAKLRLAGDE